MTLDWDGQSSSPEGADEELLVPLDSHDPALAHKLRRRYAERWIVEAELPPDKIEEAMDTIELTVAADEARDLCRLRLRSFYTGSTYWLYEWDRADETALHFVDEVAVLQGQNVKDDRKHGPTPWDESPSRRRKRLRRAG